MQSRSPLGKPMEVAKPDGTSPLTLGAGSEHARRVCPADAFML